MQDNASHSSQLSLFRAMDADTARAKGLQLPKLEKPIDTQPIMQVIELEAKFVLDSKFFKKIKQFTYNFVRFLILHSFIFCF